MIRNEKVGLTTFFLCCGQNAPRLAQQAVAEKLYREAFQNWEATSMEAAQLDLENQRLKQVLAFVMESSVQNAFKLVVCIVFSLWGGV